ncbi:MAG: LacI family DNA-binding transcriptional regulator [Chloroflexota bacterium]
MATQKLTIQKIADLAQVSKATVSRVLNDYPHISDEVKARVLKIVHETGYRRNHIARTLASSRSNMIGLVIPSDAQSVFTDPYFPTLTQGITYTAKRNEQTLALFLCESEEEGGETIASILSNGLLDGIIITADYKDYAFEKQLLAGNVPFVFIGRPFDTVCSPYIDTDNQAGGELATAYLIEQGYQRIAIIGSDKNTSGDDRYIGYQRALEKHGRALDESLVVFGDYSMESGAQRMEDLLPAKPDAVFITSDAMALGAIRTLHRHNLRVPEDIAIVGFDDLSPALQADPQLTTIRQPIGDVGSLAVETLLEIIRNPERPPRQIALPVELIVRASA